MIVVTGDPVKEAISDVVASSKNLQNTEFEVYGYTDRIGSDAYNQKLSQKRADAVTSELQAEGVNTVKASEGRGKASPVTGNKCDSVKGRQAVIDCLAPDRRGESVVTGDTVKVGISDVVASSKNLQNTEFEVYGYTNRIG